MGDRSQSKYQVLGTCGGTCGTVGAGDVDVNVDVDVAVVYGTTINNDDYLRHVFSANLYLVLEYQVSRIGYCVLKVMVQ